MTKITDKQSRLVWEAMAENARGQLTQEKKGTKITIYNYDERGLPSLTSAAGVLDILYDFDSKGNLVYRNDYIQSNPQSESFTYDTHNRLVGWTINGSTTHSIAYNLSTGNIQNKSDIGNYTMNYGENGKPHALTSISGVPTNFPTDSLNITYTDFKKIKTLTEGNKHYSITYGIDDQRRRSIYKENNENKEVRYYLGNYEEKTDHTNGITEKIHYLSGAIYIERSNGTSSFYYAYTDYLGSLIALTNESGTVVERYAYDPWGKRRNPANWTQDDTRTNWIVNRGYTMHEHLDAFSIINMNGRVYDPLTAMFFSPDPFVQAPDNWLNYNRYAYAYGNPFRYTDPSGELFYIIPSISWSPSSGLSISISAGIGIYGVSSVGGTIGYNFKNDSWSFTANASLGGLYVYGGYDTKSNWIAGGGYGFGLLGQNGGFGLNTNLTSIGVNWSQNGGWSANVMGMQYSQTGIKFDPSVGVNYKVNIEVVKNDINSLGVCKMNESCFKSKSEYSAYLKKNGFEDGKYHIDKFEYQEMTIDSNGKIRGGTTKAIFVNKKLVFQSIIMQPHSTINLFVESFNHELIHAYDNYKYGYFNARKSYTETKAYRWSDRYLNHSTMPKDIPYYNGVLNLNDLPTYLIPTPTSYLPIKIL